MVNTNVLKGAIKTAGLSQRVFAEEIIGMSYVTFRRKCNKNYTTQFKDEEIDKIKRYFLAVPCVNVNMIFSDSHYN